MKKFKVSLAALAIMMSVVGSLAFTTFQTEFNWQYDGSGSKTDPNNYIKVTAPPSCPQPLDVVCYIIAPSNGANPERPVISSSLATEITNAESSNLETAKVKLRNAPL